MDALVESLQVKLKPSFQLTFFLTERMQNLVRYHIDGECRNKNWVRGGNDVHKKNEKKN